MDVCPKTESVKGPAPQLATVSPIMNRRPAGLAKKAKHHQNDQIEPKL